MITEGLEKSNRKKTGGRKKGTPNKASLKVRDVFETYGICPLSEIVVLAEELPAKDKIQVYFKLLPYLYPKRTAEDEHKINFSLFDDENLDALKKLF